MPAKPATLEKSAKPSKPVEPVTWFYRLSGGMLVRLAVVVVVLLGLGVLLGWVVAVLSQSTLPAFRQVRAAGTIVMISGRDDHGLLQDPSVSLFDAPESNTVVARASDASFARVVGQRGEWIKVQLLGSPEAVGWVNDYYLRSRVLRTDVGVQVDLVGARELGTLVYVGVRPALEPEATPVWLNPAVLQEIGADIHK
ncbi:MAG: hypothetical protein QOH93_2297 [Chloroflexia bacterium]|jgi:hypothetical protein|nr:hypothetical protein [Chloroflexia bacterium]